MPAAALLTLWSIVEVTAPAAPARSTAVALVAVCAVLILGVAALAMATARNVTSAADPALPFRQALQRRAPDLRTDRDERERTVDLLARHFADGRLSEEEFEARARAAWTARIRRDLIELLVDLPALDEP